MCRQPTVHRVDHVDAVVEFVEPAHRARTVIVSSGLARRTVLVDVDVDGVWPDRIGTEQLPFCDAFGEHVVAQLLVVRTSPRPRWRGHRGTIVRTAPQGPPRRSPMPTPSEHPRTARPQPPARRRQRCQRRDVSSARAERTTRTRAPCRRRRRARWPPLTRRQIEHRRGGRERPARQPARGRPRPGVRPLLSRGLQRWNER
jgi:hypothetical protein